MRIQEKIAGTNATGNKDPVIGVDLRAFVAPNGMVGQTLQTDAMALLAEKQFTNVLYNQVIKFFEFHTFSTTLELPTRIL